MILLTNARLFSQVLGDYRSISNGTWTNVSNWEVYDGVAPWSAATEFPGQTINSGGNVTISDNTIITIDQPIPQPISSLVISAVDNSTSLTFTGAYTLNINGSVSFSIPNALSTSNNLDISSGILNCSSLSMITTSDGSKTQNIIISTGELNISGSFTMSAATQNTLKITSNGKLRIGDTFSPVTPITLSPTSIIEYNGTISQTISAPVSGYKNLILSGSGSKTLQANIIVNSSLSIGTGVDFNDGGFTITGLGGALTLASGASYTTARTASPWFPTLSPVFDNNSSVIYSSNGNYTIPAITTSYGSLTFNGTGTHTLSNAVTINKDLTINAGTVNDGGFQITGNGSGLLTQASGTGLTLGSAITATLFPTNYISSNITLNAGSTVTYNSKIGQFISEKPIYSNVTLTSASAPAVTKTAINSLTINGTFTVNANNIFDDNGKIINCNGSIIINGSHVGGGKLYITGSLNPQYISGTGSANTIEVAKTAGTLYLNSNFTINGILIISTGAFSLNARVLTTNSDITIANGATFTVNGNATLKVANGKIITNLGTCTFVGTTSTVALITINGSSTDAFSFIQNSSSATLSARYYEFDNCHLTISNGAILNNLSNGTFSNGTGTEYINFDDYNLNVSPTLVMFNNGPPKNVRKTTGTGIINFAGASGPLSGQTFEIDNGIPGSLITWTSGNTFYSQNSSPTFGTLSNWKTLPSGGTAAQFATDFTSGINTFIIQSGDAITVDQNIDAYHITVNAGGTLTIGSNSTARTVQVEEDIQVDNGGYVTVGNYTATHIINLYGNLIVNGTFDLNNSTGQVANINFYNNASQTIEGTPILCQFNSINLGGITSLTPNFTLDIQGNVTIGANTTFNTGSFTHTVVGNWTGNSLGTHNSSGTIKLTGTTQLITNQCNFNNLEISGSTTTIGGSPIVITGNLLLSNSATLTLGNNTTARALTVNGDIQVDLGSSFTVGAFNTTHTLTLLGNLIVNGSFSLYNTALQICNITFSGTSNSTISGSVLSSTCKFNIITLNKGVDNTLVLDINRPISQQAPTVTATSYLVLTNGTLKISSATVLTPYYGSVTICSATSKLWINDPSASISCVGAGITKSPGTPTLNGILQVTAGTFEYGSGNDRLALTAATSALIVDGTNATVKLYGGINNNGSGTLTMSAGNIIVDCQRTVDGGDDINTAVHVVDLRGVINLSGGKLTIVDPSNNPTIDGNATLLLWTLSAADNFIGSTIQFGDGISNSQAKTTDGFDFRTDNIGTYYLGNIILNTGAYGNGTQITNRHVKFIGGNAYWGGTIDSIYSGSELQLNGLSMYVKGNLVNNGVINSAATNSTLILNGTTQQVISGSGSYTSGIAGCLLNLNIDNTSGASPSVYLQSPLTIQTAYNLTNGSLNTSGIGILTLGTNTGSTLSITRTNGSLQAVPTWNLTGVTCNIRYNNASGTITTGNELLGSSDGTIATLTTNNTVGSGVLLNKSAITVGTSLTLLSGIFNLQNNAIYINGTIARNGTTQTGTLSTLTGASIVFQNTTALTIPSGSLTLTPTELNNITVNTTSSVTMSAGQNILLRGSIILGNGAFAIGSGTLSFHLSNTPIVKTGGTITTTTSSSLAFGSTGNTSGAAFTIPLGTFTTATAALLNIIINRDNALQLSQPISLSGTLTLTKGILDNNNLLFTTSGNIPFVRPIGGGTLTIGTTGSITFNTNATSATIPNGLFTSAPVTISALTMNRAGGVILGDQEINVTGITQLTTGLLTIVNSDLQIQSIGGTPSATKMITTSASGNLKRWFTTGANAAFTFPIGDNTGTAEYSPVTITFGTNAVAGYVGLKVVNAKHPNNSETNDYLKRYWTYTTSGLTSYTYSATYTYTPADYIGSSENALLQQRWDGSNWTSIETSSTNSSTHILSSGATLLSEATTSGTLNGNSITAYASNKYYWSKATGDWGALGTWEYTTTPTDVGPYTTATAIPTYANSKAITVRSGHNVTLVVNGYTADELVIKSGGTLTMANRSLTLYNGIGNDLSIENGGLVTSTSGQLIANSTGIAIDISGTFNTTNALGFSGGPSTTAISATNTPSITLNPGSTVEYSGAAQTITTATSYQNLKISGTLAKSISNSLTIYGDLTITGGSLAFLGATPLTLTVNGNLSATTTTIDISTAAHSIYLGGATNTLTTSTLTTGTNLSTITYNRLGDQTMFGSANYRNVTISGSGTKTLLATTTVNNTLTINNSTILADGGFTCNVKGDLINNGTHSGTGKMSINAAGTSQTITCGTATFGNLEIDNNNGSLSILGTQALITGNFTVTFGTTLTQNTISSALTVNGLTTINGVITFADPTGTKTFNNIIIDGSLAAWVASVPINFTINGNVTVINGGLFSPGSGEYSLGGSSNQSIDKMSGFKLALNKTAGIVSSTLPSLTLTGLNLKPGNLGTFQAPATLSITGDLTINSGLFDVLPLPVVSNLLVSGNITVTGGTINWETNVTLKGTTNQLIAGTTSIPSFNNLIINNTASGDAIVLNNPISINNQLTLTDGIIKTDATNIILMNSSATLGGTPSDNSFINGPMRYSINTTGSLTKTFPVGKLGKMHKSEITVNQLNNSYTTYTCEYFNGSAISLHALPTTTGLKYVSNIGYWHIDKNPESLDITSGDDASLVSALIKLYYLSNDGVTDPSHLFVAKSHGPSGDWKNVGGTGGDATSITSGTFKAFCDLCLASDSPVNPLPISLTKFDVQKKNEDVSITWETASETDNDFFTLERSTDGKTWESIFTCDGAGNSTTTNVYGFVDREVLSGIYYYRLKQTDVNGEFTYSEVKSIRISSSDLGFTVYPNPANYYCVNVVIKGKKDEQAIVQVTDNIGRIIYSGSVILSSNEKLFNLSEVCHLNPGVFYTISVISEGKTISKKVSVQ